MSNYITESGTESDIESEDHHMRLRELVFPASVEIGDNVGGRLLAIGGQSVDIRIGVTQFSPLGVSVVVATPEPHFQKGQQVDLELAIGGEKHPFAGVVVERAESIANEQLVTLRLVESNDSRPSNAERREGARWLCGEQFFPTAIAANPARYNDFVYFKIKDLSKSGARFITSLRNKFIVRGMCLECLVSFPLVSQINITVVVRNVTVTHEQGKDLLSIGVEFLAPEKRDLTVIAQYLLQFGDAESLESLREAGLTPSSVGKAIQYSFVRSEEDYQQVLELRTQAYAEAGKLAPDVRPEQMADSYDAKSKIIIGKYKGRVVSSARMYFPQYGDSLEQEEYLTWPPSIGRRDEVVEVMRICTHKDFRRSDLLLSLFRFIAVTAIQGKRHKIVGCATEALLPLYEKVGSRNTGLSYELPTFNNLRHWMIVADARRSITGLDVGPLVWNLLWKDTAEYLLSNEYLTLDLTTRVRLAIYRGLGPLAHILQSRSRRPRKRSNLRQQQ